jgi:TolB-like protein/DNA-binding winged helix-turn-helix (wHTH) protein
MPQPALEIYEFGEFQLNVSERTLAQRDGGEGIALPEKAFQTLVYLVRHAGALVRKESILAVVWPGVLVEEGNISKVIHAIRAGLGQRKGGCAYIETVPKHGYRFIADVTLVATPASDEPSPVPLLNEAPRDRVPATHEDQLVREELERVLSSSQVRVTVGHPVNGRPRWLAVSLVCLIGAATAAAGVRWLTPPAPIPIAVLPLVNLSEFSGNDAFVDGLTDELIRQVSGVAGLRVRSRTSSFALKNRPHTLREAAGQLKVDYIVEGSVARSGPQARITAQLVRASDDVPLWTGTFERQVRDVLAIQQEVSRGIVNAVLVKIGRGPRRYDPDAYDLYLRARAVADVRFAGDDAVIGLFEQAIGKDPSMAPAYAGLAVAYAFRSFQSPVDPQRVHELDTMRGAADRALQLDPSLAEAHSALGVAYARTGQWDRAERSFRRAIELDPDLATTRDVYARFVLWPLGRMDDAVREARTATNNDPLSRVAQRELAEVLLGAGRYDEAARYCEQLPTDIVSAGQCVGRARLAQGRMDDGIQFLASSAANNWGYLAYAYARSGRRDKAETVVGAAPTRYPNRHGPFQYALVFAGFEDKDRTIEQLRKMAEVGPVRIGFTLNSPEFAFLHNDDRVKELRRQVGLTQ